MIMFKHYGTPRHSGRYPWGSGKNPYQSGESFLSNVKALRAKGMSDSEIAKGMGMNSSEFRDRITISREEAKAAEVKIALQLKNKGYSNVAIGKKLGKGESYVRTLLKPKEDEEKASVTATANMLKENVSSKKYIDIGVGTERYMGISRTKLGAAVTKLKDQGYTVHYIQEVQLGTGNKTSFEVLAAPGVTYSEVYKNRAKIATVHNYSENEGRSFLGLEKPRDISSDRIMVRYGDEGGSDKDGVIELRRGVKELSLGSSNYAQVRISVDGTHYLKGMAIYSDNMPDGVDIIYNSNKKSGTPKKDVFKAQKADPDNPFGAIVRQKHYIDENGKQQLSALNIVREEGEWSKWSKTLSSQFVSKQSTEFAKEQLGLMYRSKKEEYDEISILTNPVIKKKLLESFADDCDSAAVHLKAAALPRQSTNVILPVPGMKDNEIYAPNFRNGEVVILVRHPHGGIFELPRLRVNNKNKEARETIGMAKDAVGINSKVAAQLSGADFDGDTVLVLPDNNGKLKTSAPLKELQDFDPKASYPMYKGMTVISHQSMQQKMGDVSNLITDMTIGGAKPEELARAIRYSMVIIDSEKHKLNYKQAYIDNGISDLKRRYQGSATAGASTLISRSKSQTRVNTRKELTNPSKMTPEQLKDYNAGKKVYEYTNETYTDAKGKTVYRQVKSTKMAEVDDAYELSSGTKMEGIYADHANSLKALANEARAKLRRTEPISYSPSAKKVYAEEVESLDRKLNDALMNAPMERQAVLLSNYVYRTKLQEDPFMDNETKKKIKGQALTEARVRVGAKKQIIEITDKEWDAIQAGAISTNKLTQIINNTDMDRLKELATPRETKKLPPAKLARAQNMLSKGYTQAEVADALGVSVTTLLNSIE